MGARGMPDLRESTGNDVSHMVRTESMLTFSEADKARVMKHVNEDHADTMLAFACFYGKLSHALAATPVDVSMKEMTLKVSMPSGTSHIKVAYTTGPLGSTKDIRPVMVKMHKEAFDGLGFLYKERHGLYKKPLTAKRGIVAVLAVACVAVFVFRRSNTAG